MRYTTVLACLMVSAAALAGEPAAAQISHQGQNVNDHVVLRDRHSEWPRRGNLPFQYVFQRQGPV